MTDQINDICALCKHFKMKEYPDHAWVGLGRCMGYDKDIRTLSNPFTPWSTKACVRFRQDWAGTEKRMEWIERKRGQQHQNNNAAQPETKEWNGKRHQTASDITKRS